MCEEESKRLVHFPNQEDLNPRPVLWHVPAGPMTTAWCLQLEDYVAICLLHE